MSTHTKSFFRYLENRVPGCLDLSLQVRAIPQKHADKPLIDWLDPVEMQAILDAPDTTTVAGLRDRAMLFVCYAAGLRVSELTALTLDSLSNAQLENSRPSAFWGRDGGNANCRCGRKSRPSSRSGWTSERR